MQSDELRRRQRQRGAVIPIFALILTTLVIIAAIVVDLGMARAVRRDTQSAADFATLAATQALSTPDGDDPVGACDAAIDYLADNLPDLDATELAALRADVACATEFAGVDEYACLNSVNGGSPMSAIEATGSAGDYTVSIMWPVPNSEIADPNVTSANNLRVDDGWQPDDLCDRIKVEVGFTQGAIFSGIVGESDRTTSSYSVGRRLPWRDVRTPNLWLLEPYDCDVLNVPGGAELIVGDISRWQNSGLITIDSDGSDCQGNSFVIDVQGGGYIDVTPNDLDTKSRTLPNYGPKIGLGDPCIQGQIPNPPAPIPSPYPADNSGDCIDPPGKISIYAYSEGQTNCVGDPAAGNVFACSELDTPPVGSPPYHIEPIPSKRALRATRAPVDWKYDCHSNYPDYLTVIEIPDCIYDGTTPPWVSSVLYWQANSNARSGGQGFARWRVDGNGACGQPFNNPPQSVGGNTVTVTPGGDANGNDLIELEGNWVLDCDIGSSRLNVSGGTIAFTGGHLISTSEVLVQNNGILIVNSEATSIDPSTLQPTTPLNSTATATLSGTDNGSGSSCAAAFTNANCWRQAAATAAWYWQDEGSLHISGDGQIIMNNTAVFLDSRTDNSNRFYATGGITYWTPPTEGPFEALSLWAEAAPNSGDFGFTGQASVNLAGTFFTPYAYPFKISGGGSLTPQSAQFVARTLTVTGGGVLNLDPTGLELVDIPPPVAVLIR